MPLCRPEESTVLPNPGPAGHFQALGNHLCRMQHTFRERYCRRWAIPPEQFEEHLLPRALYPSARILRPLLGLRAGYFHPDREFIRAAGDLRSRRFFHAEAGEFHGTEANHRFLRRWLRLRVSAERTRRLMEECWGADAGSASPIIGR